MADKTTSDGGRGTSGRTGATSRASTGRGSATRAVGGSGRASATATATATDRMAAGAKDITHPERSVVKDPPPAPDYPRFRVEPGAGIRLADVDPD